MQWIKSEHMRTKSRGKHVNPLNVYLWYKICELDDGISTDFKVYWTLKAKGLNC